MRLRPDPVRHPAPIPWRRVFCGSLARLATWAIPAAAIAGVSLWGPRHTTSCGFSGDPWAISSLSMIASCQEQYRSVAIVDEDGDGAGEYGGLLEMACGTASRGNPGETFAASRGCPGPRPIGSAALTPQAVGPAAAPNAPASRRALLSGAFLGVAADGSCGRSGYRFRVVLMRRDGTPGVEAPGVGFGHGNIDPDAAEARFVCYAWPATAESGARTFVVDQTGTIYAARTSAYAGAAGPPPGAAMTSGGLQSTSGAIVPGVPAQDGNVWTPLN